MDDYIKDGLLYCGKCNTPKQVKLKLEYRPFTINCLCKCETAENDRKEAEFKVAVEAERIRTCRAAGMQDNSFKQWTFATDDGQNPKMIGYAKKYVDGWSDMLRTGIGLLIWGNVGTGKTFMAACIANALLDMGVPVLMTTFIRMANEMGSFYDSERNAYLKSMSSYKLLVIDDLGTERQSETMMENVYSIIDSRYKSGLPMIITTNLTIKEIKNPKDMKYSRIYDRILERCAPIAYEGTSRRVEASREMMEQARKLLIGE